MEQEWENCGVSYYIVYIAMPASSCSPMLSWRDVQYLVAHTSRAEGVGHSSEWKRNGGGLLVSDKYGFGAVDAEALVSRARHWLPVPSSHSCSHQQPLIRIKPRYSLSRHSFMT